MDNGNTIGRAIATIFIVLILGLIVATIGSAVTP